MKSQWQIYRELELIPDSAGEPCFNQSALATRLKAYMQSRVNNRISRFSYDQQIEHLEQCFYTDWHKQSHSFWQRCWAALNRILLTWEAVNNSEPEVHQSLDDAGRVWWQVYDPKTGDTLYMESEEEVMVWIEDYLRY
ncbi:MAG: hypothetical protein Kow00121_14440 [Elainellaceae cyanobacterium]